MLRPRLITPPASLPVSLDQAKRNCNVDHDEDDELFDLWIRAATEILDGHDGVLGRCLVSQTWEQTLPVGSLLRLPISPVQSIESISYVDADGNTVELAGTEYDVDPEADAFGPFVNLRTPPTAPDGKLTVRYVAGYGEPDAVPASIKQAILLLVSSFNEYREKDLNLAHLQTNPNYKGLIGRLRLRRI